MKTDIHNKDFARRLALKERLKMNLEIAYSISPLAHVLVSIYFHIQQIVILIQMKSSERKEKKE